MASHSELARLIFLSTLLLLQRCSDAFLTPATHYCAFASTRTHPHVPTVLRVLSPDLDELSATLVAVEGAFEDTGYVFDDNIRNLCIAFVVVIAALIGSKSLFGSMDSAIEKVLQDFEATMRTKYPRRWKDMAKEMEGLEDEQRSIKLMSIMEKLQEEDPEFSARVNNEIAE